MMDALEEAILHYVISGEDYDVQRFESSDWRMQAATTCALIAIAECLDKLIDDPPVGEPALRIVQAAKE